MLNLSHINWKDPLGWGFDDLSLEIGQGHGLILKGVNGAGKSTLLRILAGLIPLETPLMLPPLHYVGHKLGLIENVTVGENLRLFETLYRATPFRTKAVIERWHLESLMTEKVRHLSQGQKRRVSLARLDFEPRPLWLLDEPTAGLDDAMKMLFISRLEAYLAEGGAAVLALHEDLPFNIPFKRLDLDQRYVSQPFAA